MNYLGRFFFSFFLPYSTASNEPYCFVNTFFLLCLFYSLLTFWVYVLLVAFIHSLHLFLWYFTNVAKLFFFVCLSLVFLMKFLISNNKYWCVCGWVRVCVLLKLTCKSVLFRYPEINNKQNSKHFKLNQQKNLCACVKNNFLQISHKKKKRMSCIFIIFLLHF